MDDGLELQRVGSVIHMKISLPAMAVISQLYFDCCAAIVGKPTPAWVGMSLS